MIDDPIGRKGAPATRDYFAEMYVAGVLADAGWDVYFPRRDKGFDMVVSRSTERGVILRPVQVKGKYATDDKTDKAVYGYVGKLTATHPAMILAMPFFTSRDATAPRFIAWAPWNALRRASRGHAFQPTTFRNGEPHMRRDFARYFGAEGLELLENEEAGS